MAPQKWLRSDKTHVQCFASGVVGALALLVDTGVLWGLTEYFSIHYLWSASWGFLAGLGTNYFLSIRFVFPVRRLTNRQHEFSIFAAIGALGLVMNDLCIWYLVEHAGFYYLWAKLITAGIVFFWNFFLRKGLLFSVPHEG